MNSHHTLGKLPFHTKSTLQSGRSLNDESLWWWLRKAWLGHEEGNLMSLIAQLVRARHRWGFQTGMWLPGPGFDPRRRQHVSTDFNTVSGWPVFQMWSRSLVPGIVYRASKKSHGTLMNPGIQVECQWKLTWSYMQSTKHITLEPLLAWQARRSPSGER